MALSSWARLSFFGPKPFGIVQKSLGKHGFKTIGKLHIGDALEVFEEIKKRMFGVLSYWFEKGLVSEKEVEFAFGVVEGFKNRVFSRSLWSSVYFGHKKVGVKRQKYWGIVGNGC